LRTEPTGASSSTLPMPAIALPTFCVDNTYCLTTHCSGRGDSGALQLFGSVSGLRWFCPRR
jgi:hypothetical protein